MVGALGHAGPWLVALMVGVTLGAILLRPFGMPEAAVAGFGALLMAAVGAIGIADVRAVLGETADVLVFLLGMTVLSGAAEQAGVFAWLAERVSRWARGSGPLLFTLVFALGAVITALLSLDVTILIFTPIIFSLTQQRRLDPWPFLFACVFIANIGSLILPISNLTNLLVYDQLQLDFGGFVARLWLPHLVAVLTTLAVLAWLFRRQIPRRYDAAVLPPVAVGWWPATAGVMVAGTLAGLMISGLLGYSLIWAALAGGGGLLLIGVASRRLRPRAFARSIPWPIFAFVVGMFLVVRGFDRVVLSQFALPPPTTLGEALLASVGLSAVGSNIVNNVPMTLLALTAIERAPAASREALTYGTLVGVNLGAALTTYGSLATMLWFGLLRERGLNLAVGAYLRVAVITTPVVLITTTVALWLVLR